MPDNRKSLIYGAFPVCRNYTVRAHIRHYRPGTWDGYQDHLHHHKACFSLRHAEHLRPCVRRDAAHSICEDRPWDQQNRTAKQTIAPSPGSQPRPPSSHTRASGASQAQAVSPRSTTSSGRAATPLSGRSEKASAQCLHPQHRGVRTVTGKDDTTSGSGDRR